jgi:hypothetical protein
VVVSCEEDGDPEIRDFLARAKVPVVVGGTTKNDRFFDLDLGRRTARTRGKKNGEENVDFDGI